MKKGENKKGFTIIEVVLVLGIAGLIFLMMMIALPALRRTQADSQRKDDIARLLSAIKNYQTNNRGALPTEPIQINELETKYLPDNFTDPDGEKYVLVVENCDKTGTSGNCKQTEELESSVFPNGHQMYVMKGATCGDTLPKKAANNRKVAVAYKLEAGVFCNNT